MFDHFMLNGNLLRTNRWECRQNTKQREIGIDLKNRLREVISPSVKLFSYRNRVARSLFTTTRKKQIAFIISQICLMICIVILLVNIPPIIIEILTAEGIIVLVTKIITLALYIVILGFIFFMLFAIWIDKIQKFKEKYFGDSLKKYLRHKIDWKTGDITYEAPTEQKPKIREIDPEAEANTTTPGIKLKKGEYGYYRIKHEGTDNEQEDTNSKGEVLEQD